MRRILFFFNTLAFAALFAETILAQSNFWRQTSGPYTGRVSAIGVTRNHMVFVAENWGIWTSSDYGQTWRRERSVRWASCFVENAQGDIFAGAGGVGVYRSTNDGSTWVLLKNGLPQYSSPPSLHYLSVTRTGRLLAATFGSGLFTSTDNGENWFRVTAGLTDSVFYSVVVSPAGDCYCSSRNGGIFRSTDDGVNWTYFGLRGRNPFSLHVISNGIILAGLYQGGIVRSSDGGVTWNDVASTERFVSEFSSFMSGDIVAATSREGIIRSTDSGQSWARISFPDSSIRGMAVDTASRTESFYAASSRGFYVSRNLSCTWTAIPFSNSMISSLEISEDGTLYAGGYGVSGIFTYGDYGTYYSTDRGEGWAPMGPTGVYVDDLIREANYLVAAFRYPGCVVAGCIGRTTNQGVTWSESSPGETFSAMVVNSRGEIFARTWRNKVLRSRDGGVSWDTLNLPAAEYFSDAPLAVAPNGFLYTHIIGPAIDRLLRSTDNGETWSELDSIMTKGVVSLVCNEGNSVFGGRADDIIRSTDDGATWTALSSGIGQVISLGAAGTDILIAGTDSGKAYQSRDNGDSWSDVSAGLNGEAIFDIRVAPDGFAYLATEGGGVYRSTSPVTAVREDDGTVPTVPALLQNYPNPFNLRTAVSFQLSAVSRVTLRVYDVLGREVAVLVDEKKPAGKHTVEWDASRFSSGLYFYKIQAGDFSQTKKMILTK